MDGHIDKVLQGMSIYDEDESPLVLPNERNFCSRDRNIKSIIGRFLNPDNQRMSKWILDMPRIWRLYDRVKGIALSRDRFQFIFKLEEDLNEVLKIGVWTQDDWSVVMERWVEDPPPNYLMRLPIWIRLRNIPVNYYTKDTITRIAERIGPVIDFPFDEEKSQSRDFVRIRINFDVCKGLKNSTDLQLPNGSVVKIGIDYERIRKRCFICQRLSHEKSCCPYNSISNQSSVYEKDSGLISSEEKGKGLSLSEEARQINKPLSPKLTAESFKALTSQTLPDIHYHQTTEEMTGTSHTGISSVFCTGSFEEKSFSGLIRDMKSCKRPRAWTKIDKNKKERNIKLRTSSDDILQDQGINSKSVQKGKGISIPSEKDKNSVVPGELPQDQ